MECFNLWRKHVHHVGQFPHLVAAGGLDILPALPSASFRAPSVVCRMGPVSLRESSPAMITARGREIRNTRKSV